VSTSDKCHTQNVLSKKMLQVLSVSIPVDKIHHSMCGTFVVSSRRSRSFAHAVGHRVAGTACVASLTKMLHQWSCTAHISHTTTRAPLTTHHTTTSYWFLVVEVRSGLEYLLHEVQWSEVRLQRINSSFQCQQKLCDITLPQKVILLISEYAY
jgi:hypothetical protein